MKTWAGVFSTMILGLTLTGSVGAVPIPGDDTRSPHDRVLTPRAPRSGEIDGEQPRVVTGRVLRVNAQEGTLVIQTPIGVIALRGPKEDLRDVNVGDIVQVEMVDGEYPSASPRIDQGDEQ